MGGRDIPEDHELADSDNDAAQRMRAVEFPTSLGIAASMAEEAREHVEAAIRQAERAALRGFDAPPHAQQTFEDGLAYLRAAKTCMRYGERYLKSVEGQQR